jgi:flap endonuclease-1
MGTQLGPIITSREIKIEDLTSKRLVVDSFNMLYQFLTTIRQYDGAPLTDSKGTVTSHLSGLFFRITNLMKHDIKFAFVFDGKAPDLKKEEKERRAELKQEAVRKYEQAVDEGDIELMKKYASRATYLTKEMVEEAKELIIALGHPVIQAPSEGEAQASYMVKKGEFYASISQDTDGLMFGCPRMIKNLSISRKKKKTGTSAYETTNPEIVELSENLNHLGVDNDQLIVIGMLCGTDFNIGGIKGIGPKKALDLVKKHKKDFDKLFEEAKWSDYFTYTWKEVFHTIKDMQVTDDYTLTWKNIDEKKIYEIMVDKHEFSKDRVEKAIESLMKKGAQRGLSDFF